MLLLGCTVLPPSSVPQKRSNNAHTRRPTAARKAPHMQVCRRRK
jgi:hypothetical protein